MQSDRVFNTVLELTLIHNCQLRLKMCSSKGAREISGLRLGWALKTAFALSLPFKTDVSHTLLCSGVGLSTACHYLLFCMNKNSGSVRFVRIMAGILCVWCQTLDSGLVLIADVTVAALALDLPWTGSRWTWCKQH